MSKCLSILGGRIIDPAINFDQVTDIHLADGKIIAIGEPPEGFVPDWKIDANQQIVCPGLVDLSVRLREPGAEHKGTIISETRAAAGNGITTVCCPPDTNPVIDTPAIAELLQQRAMIAGMAKVLPLAALTKGLQGQQLAEMGDLKEAGCIGVSNALQPITNTEILRYAFEYAANCDLSVFLYAQEPWLGQSGCIHEGITSMRLGLRGIPEQAETIAVARDLLLIELTGVRAHFCRLSTARAIAMVKEAQARGLPVTVDVSAHHLFLIDEDIGDYNGQCHVYPPLRSDYDRKSLRAGLLDNTITAICSDHQPHEADAKLNPFASTAAGISGLDTLLPLCLKLAQEMEMPLTTLLGFVTYKPAQVLGIDAGTLAIGKPADICIFDPHYQWQLHEHDMQSRGHNSPFLSWKFKGKATTTLINGQVVYVSKIIE